MDFLPKPNQKIEIKVLFGNHAGAYPSYVEEIDNRSILVAHPIKAGHPIPLGPGHAVRIEYVATGAKITFNTRVLAVQGGDVPLIRVAIPDRSEVERKQLRDFVRQEVALSLSYKVIFAPDEEENPRPDVTHRSRTMDISGSGAQILCSEEYQKGTHLDIIFDLGGTVLRLVGEVIRVFQANEDKSCWTAVRFLRVPEKDRDVIIRFIFNLQREMRKKGLL